MGLRKLPRQVYNTECRAKKEDDRHSYKAKSTDQFAEIKQLQDTMPFKKNGCMYHCMRRCGKVPTVILYNGDQINDVGRFCCPPPSAYSTVLLVNKMFSLSDVHVTVAMPKPP